MTTDGLEHQLPINAVEEALDVEIENPIVAPAALASLAHGINRRFAGPVAIGIGVEHRLQDRLQIATGDLLGNAGRPTVGIPQAAAPPGDRRRPPGRPSRSGSLTAASPRAGCATGSTAPASRTA